MSRGLHELTPYLALGAAASVPLVVAASEQFGFGGKQLTHAGSALLKQNPWALPAATACLDRLTVMLTEASQTLERFGGQVEAERPVTPPSSAAALLAARAHSSLAALPLMQQQATAALPAPLQLEEEDEVLDAHEAAVQHSGRVMRFPRAHSESAAAVAQQHASDVAAMRQALEGMGFSSLPERFTDAELMRYAITKGFLRARTEEERRRALQQGAVMAAKTAEWLTSHPFASEEELQRVSHLLRWDGTGAGGHPVLHISIGAAVNECRGPAAVSFANAIVTQLQHAVDHKLGDGQGRADRIVVVMDCSGGSALSATRIASVFKAVCASLNHHYPCRLHELVLLDLPVVMTWLVHGIKKLMHPDTRGKVRVVRNGQDATPPPEREE